MSSYWLGTAQELSDVLYRVRDSFEHKLDMLICVLYCSVVDMQQSIADGGWCYRRCERMHRQVLQHITTVCMYAYAYEVRGASAREYSQIGITGVLERNRNGAGHAFH